MPDERAAPAAAVTTPDAAVGQPVEQVAAPGGMAAAKAFLAFLPPVTLITALLFYFGWARTYAQARALGADASLFGYSTRDYLLRSVDSLYFPLIVFTALGLVALVGHQWIRGRLASAAPGRPVLPLVRGGTAMMIGGAAMVLFGLLYAGGLLGRGRAVDLLGPLALGAGVLIGAYGGWLRARARGMRRVGAWGQASDVSSASASWSGPVAAGLLLLIAALSVFWAVGNYATWRGLDLAVRVASTYRDRPAVVVYSAESLALEGVPQTRLEDPDGAYKWRYSGLRLLDHVAGTYFLMPEDWAAKPRLILLAESDSTRFEFSRG